MSDRPKKRSRRGGRGGKKWKHKECHPSGWTVDDVQSWLQWLCSKGRLRREDIPDPNISAAVPRSGRPDDFEHLGVTDDVRSRLQAAFEV
eukprot:SAG31_NODE_18970_length_616_cov_1.114120_1_plen_89_part_01